MWARPAVQKGANVPEPYKMKELLQDKDAMEKHAAKVSPRLRSCISCHGDIDSELDEAVGATR